MFRGRVTLGQAGCHATVRLIRRLIVLKPTYEMLRQFLEGFVALASGKQEVQEMHSLQHAFPHLHLRIK